VEISYATIQKAKDDESETEKMRKELYFLRNLVSYCKGSFDVITKFIEDIHEEYSRHAQLRMSFTAKIIELKEETLQLLLVHKEIMKWHERWAKMKEKIGYI